MDEASYRLLPGAYGARRIGWAGAKNQIVGAPSKNIRLFSNWFIWREIMR
jgi:hypothetical protein